MDSSHSNEDTSRAADHKLLTSALRYVISSRPTATYDTAITVTRVRAARGRKQRQAIDIGATSVIGRSKGNSPNVVDQDLLKASSTALAKSAIELNCRS